jgi:hypothetical protein
VIGQNTLLQFSRKLDNNLWFFTIISNKWGC